MATTNANTPTSSPATTTPVPTSETNASSSLPTEKKVYHFDLRTVMDGEDLVDVKAMYREYWSGTGLDISFQNPEAEFAAMPGYYVKEKRGWLLIASLDGKNAGTIALKCLDDANSIAEIKRLFVRPAFRRTGLGRKLMMAIIDRCRELGMRIVRLDTLTRLGAGALYRQCGFVPCAPYNYNPYHDIEYYELLLDPTAIPSPPLLSPSTTSASASPSAPPTTTTSAAPITAPTSSTSS